MMDPKYITKLTYEGLKDCTDNFSDKNYIGRFQFGKVYHGKIRWGFPKPHYVTVKIWECPKSDILISRANKMRMKDEIILLRHEKLINHPGMVPVVAYCSEGEHFAVVYDFKSLGTVYNFTRRDDFSWLQRIKVALQIACVLKFLHVRNPVYEPFLVRNIQASHILLDEEFSPKLYDFGMITGGIFPDRRDSNTQFVSEWNGSVKMSSYVPEKWTEKTDVFAFGVVLLNLLTKSVFIEEEEGEGERERERPCLREWPPVMYLTDWGTEWSLHRSLEADQLFCELDGSRIIELAKQCLESDPTDRPTMKQVVRDLMKLQIVQRHAETLLGRVAKKRSTS
ncbi:hypothetical protein RJ639_008326 [Escallonia herrerae]|uniref:Protein kinase domain-containing protein n=1 Tax=Escallonia herrerae TaxID=1293975 RepID=A0AA88VPY0_9ASTE|nr:hypothetical protein RJ639_008326 [Escallonia herrerae]